MQLAGLFAQALGAAQAKVCQYVRQPAVSALGFLRFFADLLFNV